MGNVVSKWLGGGDNGAALAAQQIETSQRQALAQLANAQSEVDQAASSTATGRTRGRRMLTALGAPGIAKLGG